MLLPLPEYVQFGGTKLILSRECTRGRDKPRHEGALHLVLKKFFSFCEVRHVLSILCMRWGIPLACLTSIYQQPMTRIAAASEACGSVHCAVYASQGEAAALPLGLPLPQVCSRL